MIEQSTYVDKARGSLVGLAVGDALGAQFEFESSDNISKRLGANSKSLNMQAGGTHDLPVGYWTDDTSMALCLADSLLEKQGYDSFNVMEKYLDWWTNGYRSSTGACFDIGGQTKQALDKYQNQSKTVSSNEPHVMRAGNGGLMRLAPAIIATSKQPIEQAIELARMSSQETHYSYEANAAAEIFGGIIWKALNTIDPDDQPSSLDAKDAVLDIKNIRQYSTEPGAFDDVADRIFPSTALTKQDLADRGGYVIDSLRIATWGFLNFDNFNDGMIEVIKLGGDTDTNGAIYGQLAGAYYGAKSIRTAWKDDLFKGSEISQLAEKLAIEQPGKIIATRFEENQ